MTICHWLKHHSIKKIIEITPPGWFVRWVRYSLEILFTPIIPNGSWLVLCRLSEIIFEALKLRLKCKNSNSVNNFRENFESSSAIWDNLSRWSAVIVHFFCFSCCKSHVSLDFFFVSFPHKITCPSFRHHRADIVSRTYRSYVVSKHKVSTLVWMRRSSLFFPTLPMFFSVYLLTESKQIENEINSEKKTYINVTFLHLFDFQISSCGIDGAIHIMYQAILSWHNFQLKQSIFANIFIR